ncbi:MULTISPECIES: hypothetical protein [Aliiglaciecola]|uniref:hypothetical protein n=1 Tax=Aliiglaciecola TaxID=1406885 RepID=UPI001C0A55A5|nr:MULTISPECIES: hypothetical protein [Aliiglaciecola]MBU2879666.1 hypothetical protein [Aliiglaciecola lipolytica]MDO6710055.1 hypothetical protein [Aliiglaciecola sp. 2_MG-2023]MDO6751203.1 hypothetical protein [Aliiglaciecola sp. 1_MG-2023]
MTYTTATCGQIVYNSPIKEKEASVLPSRVPPTNEIKSGLTNALLMIIYTNIGV